MYALSRETWHRHEGSAGSLTGALSGSYAYMNPDFIGMQIQPFVIFICIVIGAAAGACISGPLIGSSTPNIHLEEYQKSMQEGHMLLILDIPTKRANDIRKITKDHSHNLEPWLGTTYKLTRLVNSLYITPPTR